MPQIPAGIPLPAVSVSEKAITPHESLVLSPLSAQWKPPPLQLRGFNPDPISKADAHMETIVDPSVGNAFDAALKGSCGCVDGMAMRYEQAAVGSCNRIGTKNRFVLGSNRPNKGQGNPSPFCPSRA
jgi:hypothetical protein